MDPGSQPIWDMIPKTYKSLQKLADTATDALSDFQRMIHVFDVCRACGECVFDGTWYFVCSCWYIFLFRI